jgi:hypothetical protein
MPNKVFMKQKDEMSKQERFWGKEVDRLLALINEIPGKKILTLVVSSTSADCTIDVDEKGIFGYHPSHKLLFCRELHRALHESGSLVIRQFLHLGIKRKLPNGKEMVLPEKNLYGIALAKGAWYGIEAECLKKCFEIDAETGKALSREEGVHYQSLAMYSSS